MIEVTYFTVQLFLISNYVNKQGTKYDMGFKWNLKKRFSDVNKIIVAIYLESKKILKSNLLHID